MKIGFNQSLSWSNVQEDIENCDKYGYEYIELRLEKLDEYLGKHSIGDLQELFLLHNVKPLAIDSIEEFNFSYGSQEAALYARHEFTCKVAQIINCPYINIVSAKVSSIKNKNVEQLFIDNVYTIRNLADIAQKYNVKLGFEPVGNKEWTYRSIDESLRLIEKIDRENVGFTLDIFNQYSFNLLREDEIKKIPEEKIYLFHISDAKDLPIENLHPHCSRTFPGDGVIQYEGYLKILSEKGYNKCVTLEVFGEEFDDMDHDRFMKEGYEKTVKILKENGTYK